MTDYLALHREALAKAEDAGRAENAALGPEQGRGFDCGFAWVQLCPATHPFVRALKAEGIGSRHWQRGWQLWAGSTLHCQPTQSISVHQAAAQAYAKVVALAIPEGLIVLPGSRYD